MAATCALVLFKAADCDTEGGFCEFAFLFKRMEGGTKATEAEVHPEERRERFTDEEKHSGLYRFNSYEPAVVVGVAGAGVPLVS